MNKTGFKSGIEHSKCNKSFPKIGSVKAVIQNKDFKEHEKKLKFYKNLIRKHPNFIDPLVLLRDRQKKRTQSYLRHQLKLKDALFKKDKSFESFKDYSSKHSAQHRSIFRERMRGSINGTAKWDSTNLN